MSHFAVLVIGNNPEELLAPYHEFECTGIDDQYVQDVDITAEVQSHIDQYNSFKEGLKYHGLEDCIVSSETDVDKENKHKYGYAIVQDGKLIKAIDRTNPNAKWDWYQLGGIWSGYFKLKSGATGIQGERSLIGVMSGQPQPESTTADQAFKKDIDFESMINKNSALSTFAVIKDGKWYEKGKMGWWACVSNEKDQKDWNKEFTALVSDLPEDTLLSIYDCHI